MKMMTLKSCFMAAALSLSANAALAEIVVIANSDSNLSEASLADVEAVFMGRTGKIGDERVIPVDQSDGADARVQFNEKVLQIGRAHV